VPVLLDSTDGVAVAIHDLGGPEGAPVLLLAHATGFNAGAWRPFAARLAQHHRVVALDLRGHGLARTPEGIDFDWGGFVDDVVAVLDAGRDVLPSGPLHGLGHSMGGAALLGAGAQRPGSFRSLWLFEPIAPPSGAVFGTGDNPMATAAERRRAAFESVEAAIANYASKPPLAVLHPDALRGYVEDGVESQADGTVALRCRPAWEAATFRMTGGSPGWEAAAAVDVPVTVVMGRDTGPGPAAFAPALAERLPAGRLVHHPELGHFGPLEDPDRMGAEVVALVAGG
jgi:pimeloyl-ACP methyl ester carboxylesterase